MPRATATPTQRAHIHQTDPPIESAREIDALTVVIVGGSATAFASVTFFAVGFALLVQNTRG